MSTRKIRKSRNNLYAYREKLPFHARNSCWTVSPTGNYEADYQTGQKYAATFWRVCGTIGYAGEELVQILFAMHEPGRKKRSKITPGGLSGIEIGFIRGIGDIIDIMKVVPALTMMTMQSRKRKFKVRRRAVNAFAKVTQIFLDGKQAQSRKRNEEIEKEIAENNRPALRARMGFGQKAA